MSEPQKIIAIIGATGAQGRVVIPHLLKFSSGQASPWKIRGLTRDKSHRSAQELIALGVELIEGSVDDTKAVASLFKRAYGVFINTDTFQLGPRNELYTLFRLYETAQAANVKHYVFSSLPYAHKLSDWNPKYEVEHLNTKGRFADWMINNGDKKMIATNLQTGPYTDGLTDSRGPIAILGDGTRLWVQPKTGNGPYPYISLEDVGWWARYIFENPAEAQGKTYELASELVTVKDIVDTFTKVTGLKTKLVELPVAEYFDLFVDGARVPMALAEPQGITFRDNFTAYHHFYTSNTLKYDMDWINRINPNTTTLEKWMIDNKYTGEPQSKQSIKVLADKTGFGPTPDMAKIGELIRKATAGEI